jgi:hypothetical protein
MLTPPPDMLFDEAIAASFSLDPGLLLEAPVFLALMYGGDLNELDPLIMLKSIRQYAGNISIYVQGGRIQIPQKMKPSPLFGLLENMIVEVTSPRGGVFHPKLWAIRFKDHAGKASLIRLVVLTRNVTYDNSWDLSLVLEGAIGRKKNEINKPLEFFFKDLPKLANGKADEKKVAQAERFAHDLYHTTWELPDGFQEIAFYLPGSKKYSWEKPEIKRLAIISPFCSDEALQHLTEGVENSIALISRPETLAGLKEETLKQFSQCFHLHEAAEIDDGEENISRSRLSGLHAKAYLFEAFHYTEYTHLVIGSANATNAALEHTINTEILVDLSGKKSKLGGIDELIGPDGLGEYLEPFGGQITSPIDEEAKQIEKLLENARRNLGNAKLSLLCCKADKDGLWLIIIKGKIPDLEGISSIKVWPITLDDENSVILPQDDLASHEIKAVSPSSITGLIAFELSSHAENMSLRFVLNLPITGIPNERDAAIIKSFISNQDSFFRYLLILLGNRTSSSLTGSGTGSSWSKWFARMVDGEDVPLLEELVRTYSREPDTLQEIAKLIHDLISLGTEESPVPENFRKFWTVFESAIGGFHE